MLEDLNFKYTEKKIIIIPHPSNISKITDNLVLVIFPGVIK